MKSLEKPAPYGHYDRDLNPSNSNHDVQGGGDTFIKKVKECAADAAWNKDVATERKMSSDFLITTFLRILQKVNKCISFSSII